MEIINLQGDYHSHTFTFSDGANSIDELVVQAGKVGLTELAITDHSISHLESKRIPKKTSGSNTKRWKNIHNDVKVIFGVEADLLDEDGEVDFEAYSKGKDFIILSAHRGVYQGNPEKITEAYLRALEKYNSKIDCLGHLCASSFSGHLDIGQVIEAANSFSIPPELNCANLFYGKTDLEKLPLLLSAAERIYVNSDSHTLYDIGHLRKEGFSYLEKQGLI
ncbi:MAG: PHP domain-containing protein [Candidatus Woesearchaeota archaeon]